MADKLKALQPGTDHFECGGKKYYISDKLSFVKFEKLSEWNLEFAFSANFKEVYNHLLNVWNAIEANKFGTIAVEIHNIMNGIAILEQKHNVAFRICSLFIIEEGEDEINFNEAKMNEKIENWGKEYDAAFFFNFAANLVPDWINVYKIVSQTSIEEEMKIISKFKSTLSK